MKQTVGITMGDPKGIGPEVIAKAWKFLDETERACYRLYGDRAVLDAAAELAGVEFDPKQVVVTSSTQGTVRALSDAEAARLALAAINAAIEDVAGRRISSIVTAPVNKYRLQSASPNFSGHTEFLAHAAGVKDPVMMFFAESGACVDVSTGLAKQLCISLVTMHLPLKDVAKAITKERVIMAIERTDDALRRYFACPDARIAVMSLNPHAGEHGSFGTEEQAVITPAIIAAQEHGVTCLGPFPADSLFNQLADFDYDAVVAMYHDQGLLPAKLLCQGKCVNITLGLPYIRTSPSHGTAEDIAWLGNARFENMLATMRLTRRLMGWKIDDKTMSS
jgi:4-hydroxythreonine-4-phosphate dehydrogenase